MNILLLAFAIPVATILLALVLQKILRCPLLVAATFFAIFLIVTFAVFDSSFLVFAILYTILAYVTAILTRLICNIISRFDLKDNCNCICENLGEKENNSRRNINSNVSRGTWYCTTRNLPRTGFNQISTNGLENNERIYTCGNNINDLGNEPIMILTNANNIANNRRYPNNCRKNCKYG